MKTIRETIASLKDTSYGSNIISQRLKTVFWYWCRYFLAVWFCLFVSTALLSAYFIPQLPRFAKEILPEGHVKVEQGIFSTDLDQEKPYIRGGVDSILILNEKGKQEDLTEYKSGVLITATDVIMKDMSGKYQVSRISEIFDDFSLSRQQVVDFLVRYEVQIALAALSVFLLACLASLAFQIIGFVVGGLVLWIIGRVLSRSVTYRDSLKLVMYASVVPFIISVILWSSPNPLLSWLNFILFAFFAVSWVYHLPVKENRVTASPVATSPTASAKSGKRKSRSTADPK